MQYALTHLASKQDLATMASKDDLAKMASKMASKDDLAKMASKEDIEKLINEMKAGEIVDLMQLEHAVLFDGIFFFREWIEFEFRLEIPFDISTILFFVSMLWHRN